MTGHVSLPASMYGPPLGLEGVVGNQAGPAYGTFQHYDKFSLNQLTMARKIGTADISANNVKEPDAWFIDSGPIPNPKYVIGVAVGDGGEGEQATSPQVMNILHYYLVTHPVRRSQLPDRSVKAVTMAPDGSRTERPQVSAASVDTDRFARALPRR